jgi:hypothetical protein
MIRATKAEMIQRDLAQDWIVNQVTFTLRTLLYWFSWGYKMNPEQAKLFEELKERIENER